MHENDGGPRSSLQSFSVTEQLYEKIGETHFSLAFGFQILVPVEIGMPMERVDYYELTRNEDELLLNLDLLDEKRKLSLLHLA